MSTVEMEQISTYFEEMEEEELDEAEYEDTAVEEFLAINELDEEEEAEEEQTRKRRQPIVKSKIGSGFPDDVWQNRFLELERRSRQKTQKEFVEESLKTFRKKFDRPRKLWYYDEVGELRDAMNSWNVRPEDSKTYRKRLDRWGNRDFNYQVWILKPPEDEQLHIDSSNTFLRKMKRQEKPLEQLGDTFKKLQLPTTKQVRCLGKRIIFLE